MADILDELRHFAKGGAGDVSATCSDAADEIDRLRERVAELQAQCGYMESIEAVRLAKSETPLTEHEGTGK